MRIENFRIKNFKSIIDTGWSSLSPDQVTVLIGQNESGKSSILEALSKTFSNYELTSNDIRAGASLPEVFLEYSVSENFLNEKFKDYNQTELQLLIEDLKKNNLKVTSHFFWEEDSENPGHYTAYHSTILPNLPEYTYPEDELPPPSNERTLYLDDVNEVIFRSAPSFHIFDHESGLLPSTIDIAPDYTLIGRGNIAAQNYLSYAEIDLKKLLKTNLRIQKSVIHQANERVSKEFSTFWSQTIGKTNKIKFECSIEKHDDSIPEKAGKPFLAFFISDGLNRLHPQQRSTGVRWFLSFFLQLKSSEKSGKKRVFLLDEPGANLHARAQKDVLGLINRLSKDTTILYSTHSPSLIEYEKIYRIHAALRKDDLDDSPTQLIEARKLGASSSDTLSPLMTAIGADLSQQQAIKKNNNVIVEEISGFYYLKAFWELTKEETDANFIAASGVNNIEKLAYIFTGWGLEFIIVTDDDSQSRSVLNTLKRNLFLDNETIAKTRTLKIKDCPGIEDIFSAKDFASHIINIPEDQLKLTNSEHAKKDPKISKPIIALQFMLKVKNKELSLNNLEASTKKRIENLVLSIATMLKNYKSDF
jgi:predicted ATPase